MDGVRLGLVGAGFMGKIHSIAYRNAAMLFGTQFPPSTSGGDRFRSRACPTGRRDWGWSRSLPDWHEVTAADDVDVVDICTPNDTHVDIALDAFARGKHVLCEKPLALDGDGAHQLCQAAGASGRVTQVGFVYRQWPAVAMARKLIDEGAIGEVRTARARFLLDYNGNPDIPMSWRFDRAGQVRAHSATSARTASIFCSTSSVPIAQVAARMHTFIRSARPPTAQSSMCRSTTRPRSSPTSRAAPAARSSPRGQAPGTSATSVSS